MTWTRLDDTWTDKPQLEQLDYSARWHYLCMIQFACRNGRHDGIIRHVDARRASDVADPAVCIAALEASGLIRIEGTAYRILDIADHVPPPHVVKNAEQSKKRMRRMRAHKAGDHSLCLAEHCTEVTVTADVTRNTGTGRDGTGRAEEITPKANLLAWPTAVPGAPGEMKGA